MPPSVCSQRAPGTASRARCPLMAQIPTCPSPHISPIPVTLLPFSLLHPSGRLPTQDLHLPLPAPSFFLVTTQVSRPRRAALASLHRITQACAHARSPGHHPSDNCCVVVGMEGRAGSEVQSPFPLLGPRPLGPIPRVRELSWAHRPSHILTQRTSAQDLGGVPLLTCINNCCCSVAQLCPTLCNPMDCSAPGCPPVLHCLRYTASYPPCLLLIIILHSLYLCSLSCL